MREWTLVDIPSETGRTKLYCETEEEAEPNRSITDAYKLQLSLYIQCHCLSTSNFRHGNCTEIVPLLKNCGEGFHVDFQNCSFNETLVQVSGSRDGTNNTITVVLIRDF